MAERSVFRFLFRLAARVEQLDRRSLLERLVTGLANHYNALACRLYTANAGREAIATADEAEELELLSEEDRRRIDEMDVALVKRALEKDSYSSSLDLDPEGGLSDFLMERVGALDVFSFPIAADGKTYGAIVLYLPLESPPLADADQQALLAVGELARMARD